MTWTQWTYGPVITRLVVTRMTRTHIRVITGGYVHCVHDWNFPWTEKGK